MMKKIIDRLKEHKLKHELPNDNEGEYNLGFVKAINIAINLVQDNVVLPDVKKCAFDCENPVWEKGASYCKMHMEIDDWS